MKFLKKLIGGILCGLVLLGISYFAAPARTYTILSSGNNLVQDIRVDKHGLIKPFLVVKSKVGQVHDRGEYISVDQLNNEPNYKISSDWNYQNLLTDWAIFSLIGFISLYFGLQQTSSGKMQDADFKYAEYILKAAKKKK